MKSVAVAVLDTRLLGLETCNRTNVDMTAVVIGKIHSIDTAAFLPPHTLFGHSEAARIQVS